MGSKLRTEDMQRLRGLRLMDDEFMSVVFDGNLEATALLLNIFLGRNDMVVTEVVGQREIKNVNGHSVRLDIQAMDSDGKAYDIEVQRENKGAVAQRARFNSSMLDTRLLKPGEDFAKLADSYVIFITENDVIGAGLPIYHINRWIEETHALFGDGSHILYVNGAYRSEETLIGKLIHDFQCVEPEDMNFVVLSERAKYFKESEGGQHTMSRIFDEIREEMRSQLSDEIRTEMRSRLSDEIRTEMKQQLRQEHATALLAIKKLTYEEIASVSGLTVDEVKALDEKKPA